MARVRRRHVEPEPEPDTFELGDLSASDFYDPRSLLGLADAHELPRDAAELLVWLRARYPHVLRSEPEAHAHAERSARDRRFREAAIRSRRRGRPLGLAAFMATEGEGQ